MDYVTCFGYRIQGYPQYNSSYYWVGHVDHSGAILYKKEDIPDIEKLTTFDCAAPTYDEVLIWKLTIPPEKDILYMSDNEFLKHICKYTTPFKDPAKYD